MTRKKPKSLEEWKILAEQLRDLRNNKFCGLIFKQLSEIPKTVWNDDFERVIKSISQLRTKLSIRFSKEYPGNDDIFF